MKRLLCLILVVLILMCSSVSVAASNKAEDEFPFKRMAFLSVLSSAEGSYINHFVLRPVITYTDNSGSAKGALFDAVIFDCGITPKTPVEAENFIVSLFKEGINLSAAESVVADLKGGGYASKDYKYPIFVSLPYYYGAFETMEDRSIFCTYFIKTLCSVFDKAEFEHIYLAGISFSIDYDAVPDFRSECAKVVADAKLLSVAFTTIGGTITTDACFTANENLNRRFSLAESYTGATMRLNGVPSNDDAAPLTELEHDFSKFKASAIKSKPVVFTFNAFNDVYDCASALEETVPNKKARAAYDLISEIVEYDGHEPEAEVSEISEISDDVEENEGRIANGAEYWIYAAVALLSVACIAYVVFVLVKKGRNNVK